MAMLIRTSEDQSFWIDVEDSRFKVRPLTSTQESALQKKHTKVKKGFPQQDNEAIKREKFQKMVLEWENVQDIDGNDVPFSEAMRDKFAEYNPDFAWYIIRQAEQHNVADRKEEDDNLGKPQSGKKSSKKED